MRKKSLIINYIKIEPKAGDLIFMGDDMIVVLYLADDKAGIMAAKAE